MAVVKLVGAGSNSILVGVRMWESHALHLFLQSSRLLISCQVIQQDFISKYSEVMRSSDHRKQRVLLELLKLFEGCVWVYMCLNTSVQKRFDK